MAAPITVGIHTLGCKVNQCDSDRLCRALRALGLEAGDQARAQVQVVNTCSVTATADAKSRKLIRRLIQANPGAAVVVTGCYAELRPEQLRAIPGVTAVVGNGGKESLPELILALVAAAPGPPLPPAHRRCRAFVGVQDGCDNCCAYCTVPHARGAMASRPAAQVVAEVAELAAAGVREVVVCGIRLGAYRSPSGEGLPHLLRALRATGIERIRFSSLEPWDVDDGLLAEIAANPTLCPHLHLPAQSGDDQVLAAMGRRNRAADFLALAGRLRQARPGLALSTDLLVGFPGESDQAFQRTLELARQAEFCRLHVFKYSPRPGTRAVGLPGQVPELEKARRSRLLLALGEELAAQFAQRHLGSRVPVLVERWRAGICQGYAPDYLPVELPGRREWCGQVVETEIMSAAGGRAMGRPG